jgi:hypothetical protein
LRGSTKASTWRSAPGRAGSQANLGRGLANGFYNWFASLMVGQRIEDLTSGFRAVRA